MSFPIPAVIEDELDMGPLSVAAQRRQQQIQQARGIIVAPPVQPSLGPMLVEDDADHRSAQQQQVRLSKNDQNILAFLKKAGVVDIYDSNLEERIHTDKEEKILAFLRMAGVADVYDINLVKRAVFGSIYETPEYREEATRARLKNKIQAMKQRYELRRQRQLQQQEQASKDTAVSATNNKPALESVTSAQRKDIAAQQKEGEKQVEENANQRCGKEQETPQKSTDSTAIDSCQDGQDASIGNTYNCRLKKLMDAADDVIAERYQNGSLEHLATRKVLSRIFHDAVRRNGVPIPTRAEEILRSYCKNKSEDVSEDENNMHQQKESKEEERRNDTLVASRPGQADQQQAEKKSSSARRGDRKRKSIDDAKVVQASKKPRRIKTAEEWLKDSYWAERLRIQQETGAKVIFTFEEWREEDRKKSPFYQLDAACDAAEEALKGKFPARSAVYLEKCSLLRKIGQDASAPILDAL